VDKAFVLSLDELRNNKNETLLELPSERNNRMSITSVVSSVCYPSSVPTSRLDGRIVVALGYPTVANLCGCVINYLDCGLGG